MISLTVTEFTPLASHSVRHAVRFDTALLCNSTVAEYEAILAASLEVLEDA